MRLFTSKILNKVLSLAKKNFTSVFSSAKDKIVLNLIMSPNASMDAMCGDSIAPFPWHIGVNNTDSQTIISCYKVYDDFKMPSIPNKTKLISVISSDKSFTEGHRKRLKFVEGLQNHFGENIDVFGRGINDFADKWGVIAPYKYHVALENSSCDNGISEKIYDSFLGGAFPFYYGCKNISDYFSLKSFVSIDIDDIDKSIKIIESSISNQTYEISVKDIQRSKNLILDEYNIFNLMSSYCESDLTIQKNNNKNLVTKIKPESYFYNTKIQNIKKIFLIVSSQHLR